MKIAILANNYGEPWAEGGKNNVRQVALALRERHEVFVAGLGAVTDQRLVDGLRVFRYRSPWYDNRFARLGYPFGYLNLIGQGRTLIRSERPDVIFSYFETASTALVAVLLRRVALPESTLLHTVWSDWFTPSLLPLSHWLSELLPQLVLNGRLASRLGLMGVDRVLVTSRHLGRQVESLGHTARFTPTGVDTRRFRPLPEIRARRAAGEFRVGYVGHLTYAKGVSLLLDAFTEIAEIEPGIRLVLAASGDFEESAAVARRRHPRIELLGYVEAPEAFNSFDLTVLPRRASYGTATYPNVLVESMACGTPVLTSSLPAIDEIITDGVDGFLFRPNDRADLRAKLLALARDPQLLLRAGAAARERAMLLDWSLAVPAVIDEIERCPPTLARLGRTDLLNRERGAPWDAYCSRHPAATPYHLWAWGRAVATVLEHEPHYLCVEDAGRITGVLPLFLRKSRLFGSNLVSVPAANVCGPLADDDAGALRLVKGAIALAGELDVSFLELRNVAPGGAIAGALRLDPGRYVGVEIDLADGEAAVWGRLSKGIRRRVRRAQDAGLVVDLAGDVHSFYAVYAHTMKRLGSPPFSKRFFAELSTGFGDTLQFGVARLDARVAAVDSILTFGGLRYSVFAGSRADLWHLYPNQLLLWAEIKDACALGLRTFDLGRSLADSGSLEFKSAWGGRVVPLTYGYHLHRARQLPVRTPDMPLYRALGRIWSLLPDRVVTSVGPRLVKHLF